MARSEPLGCPGRVSNAVNAGRLVAPPGTRLRSRRELRLQDLPRLAAVGRLHQHVGLRFRITKAIWAARRYCPPALLVDEIQLSVRPSAAFDQRPALPAVSRLVQDALRAIEAVLAK